ncbi:hypothetical protein SETIT_6G083400v2 [Setaria italica]|uniref:Uncharacterized protein n=1 Tax=Setaria italica TaxID=4555 RepID=A0A368RJR0_SETIT|nr:hypothetical protein SETIT_6G083400v2 [Setaria italica]
MAVAPFTSADNRRPRRHRHGLAGELRPVLGGDLPVASASPRAFLGQIMHPCSGGGEVPWREAVDPGRSSTGASGLPIDGLYGDLNRVKWQ